MNQGATAALLFGAPQSPFSQPWNVIVGHSFSAFIAVSFRQIWDRLGWTEDSLALCGGLAVSCSVFCMLLTQSLHPPGTRVYCFSNIIK